MKKRFISILSGACVLLGCISQTSATEMVTSNGNLLPEDYAVQDGIVPRGFTRSYEVFLTRGDIVTVVEDPNWDIWNDTSVSVKFYSSKGPSQCYVAVYYKEDSADEWTFADAEILLIGETMSCDIPADYSFKVEAISQGGNNGNVTFEVSLS